MKIQATPNKQSSLHKTHARVSYLFVTLMLAVALIGLVGCNSNNQQESSTNTSQQSNQSSSDKLSIVASFYPMADFAEKIGGDKVEVVNLVPTGTEPHDWEPSTKDMTTIAQADLLVYNGAGMESWIENVSSSLGSDMPELVEASTGITLRDASEDHQNEGVSVDANAPGETDATDDDDEHGTTDPHVWLAPLNAKQEMKNIAEALKKLDATNAAYYQANYEKYAAECDKLDEEFKTGLTGLTRNIIVAAHEAYGYICDAYGLEQLGIEGLSADSEPDAQRMKEIIDFVKEKGVTTIFFEDLVSPKVAEAIAAETGAEAKQLNPLEGLTDAQLASGADYFSVQRENLKALIEALS